MKHLKTFEAFSNDQKVEEGWKDVGAGLMLTIAALFGGNQEAKGQLDTVHKEITLKNPRSIENYLKGGWHLKSIEIDTLWTQIKKTAPESQVEAIRLHMDKDQLFASGSFVLNDESKKDIDSVLNVILDKEGLLVKVDIEASTDKQQLTPNLQKILKDKGYTGDNKGLSSARANAVNDHLEELGVNDTLIHVNTLSEQGIQEVDQNARYVYVDFYYILPTPYIPPTTNPSFTINKKVTLERDYIHGGGGYYKFHRKNATHKNMGPVKNKPLPKDLKCSFPNFIDQHPNT